MKTLMTIKQQEQFLSDNWQLKTIQHKWSTRGYGNSKILDGRDNVIGKASGCGYDRYGSALGTFIESIFSEQVHHLAKTKCKGKRRTYKQHKDFYGMFYNSVIGKAWLDGRCGSDCMIRILNKIGFSFKNVGRTNPQSNTGSEFFILVPITKHDRKWL